MFHRRTVTFGRCIQYVAYKQIRLRMPFWQKSGPLSWSRHYSILYTPFFDSLPTRAPCSSILYTPFLDSLPTVLRYSTHHHAKKWVNPLSISVGYKVPDSRNTLFNTYITPSLQPRLTQLPAYDLPKSKENNLVA